MPRHRNPTIPGRLVGAPRRPIRYGLLARLADRRCADRDGAAGLPDPTRVGQADVLTPTVEVLTRTFEDRAGREWLQVQSDTAPLELRAAELTGTIEGLTKAMSGVEGQLAGMSEPTGQEPAERRAGESATDAAVVHLRRHREAQALRSPLLDEQRGLSSQLTVARVELVRIERSVQLRTDIGAVRVARLLAHTERRIASYERRLVTVHPAGAELNGRLRLARPGLPGWVTHRLAVLSVSPA